MRLLHAALWLPLLATSCGGTRGAPPLPSAPPPPQAAPAAMPEGASPFAYRATASANADELRVEVDVPKGAPARGWVVDPGVARFVRDVRVTSSQGGADSAATTSGEGWSVPACAANDGCKVRYRVLLGEAASSLDDYDRAMREDSAILAPPSAWMLRPQEIHAPFRLTVETAPAESFVSGLALAPATASAPARQTFEGDVGALDDTPYAAFGRFVVWRRDIQGGSVDVAFVPDDATPAVKAWIDGALGALASYYGRFPIPHAALLVRLQPGSHIGGGRTMGHGGGAVMISAGADTTARGFRHDWVLVHELIHVSFPEVGAAWAEEGIATYLEPIIRLRSGLCDVDELWRSLVEGLPQGQPEVGDRGLDNTDTWGRRYWGGALFWFIADVEIRERTGNQHSLDDVLRAINRAGGNVAVRWPLDRVLAMGDEATGVDVLVPLRAKLGAAPGRPDLDAVWKRLGVQRTPDRMIYDDAAPLAAVRKGIMGR